MLVHRLPTELPGQTGLRLPLDYPRQRKARLAPKYQTALPFREVSGLI